MASICYSPANDYYQVLGISSSATTKEIRQAYRRLARHIHPDTNPEWEDDVKATQQMVLLNEAYDVLIDSARRTEYDQARRMWLGEGDGQVCYYETPGYARQYVSQQRVKKSTTEPPVVQTARIFAYPIQELVVQLVVGIVFALMAVMMIPAARKLSPEAALSTFFVTFLGLAFSAMNMLIKALQLGGHTELRHDRLVEYSAFGILLKNPQPYERIRAVFGRMYSFGFFTFRYVVIRCFAENKAGQIYHYYLRLARVRDHDAFLDELGIRTTGKSPMTDSSVVGGFLSMGFVSAFAWAIILGLLGAFALPVTLVFTPVWWANILWAGGAGILCFLSMCVLGF